MATSQPLATRAGPAGARAGRQRSGRGARRGRGPVRHRADVDRRRRRPLRAGLGRRAAPRARRRRACSAAARIRRARSRRSARAPSRFPARSPAGPRSPSASAASASTPRSSDAISAAEGGFAVGGAHGQALGGVALRAIALGPVPSVGQRVRLPELGATLRRIAAEGPDAIYRGDDRRGDRIVHLARRRGSRGLPAALGRAAHARLSRDDGLRAPAAHSGSRGAGRPRAARARRRATAGGSWSASGWRSRTRSPTSGTAPTSPAYSTRTSSRGARAGRLVDRDRAARRHRLPLRGRRRPHGRVAHPEPLRQLRVGHRRARHRHRAPEPGSVLRRLRARRAGQTAVPHDHPRDAPARRAAARAVRGHGRLPPGAGPRPARPEARRRAWIPQARSTSPASGSTATLVLLEGELSDSRAAHRGARPAPSRPNGTRPVSAAGRRSSSKDDVLLGGSDSRKDGYAAGF